jgi:valyl-tRNA synthetase
LGRFCGWYLEAIKPNYGEGISKEVYDKTIAFFEELMKLLHPFMPFQSEEIWQLISERSIEEALVCSAKEADSFNEDVIKNFEITKELISGVRNIVRQKEFHQEKLLKFIPMLQNLMKRSKKLANVSEIHFGQKTDKPSFTFLVGATEVSIPLSENLDLGEEKAKLKKN